MKRLFFISFIISLQCLAAETKKIPVKAGYEKMDMEQFKDIGRGSSNSSSNMKFISKCKSKNGSEYKTGDKEFESCLREVELDKSSGLKNGASPSVGVSFGK
ncbi:MAG: hypothetical protein ACOYOK_00255 [Pseudobdellovibrionaceae bacterium]